MPSPQERIDAFVQRVRRRLYLRRLASAAVWSLLGVSAAMLAVALGYVVQGYAVDRRWYAVAALAALLATLVVWAARLATREGAARFADRFYRLHDALLSNLHFHRQGKSEGFYALQRAHTAEHVESLRAQDIEWRPPRRPSLVALGLLAVAALLALKQPSQAVQQRLELEEYTLATTASQKEQLEELVRELNEQTTDPLERELLEPNKLREMVEQLDETSDRKEALRQQARLETTLNEKRLKLQQKRDEHLLSDAAKELNKQRETKPLGEKLQRKEYDKAAQDLQAMKPSAEKKLSEQQKEMAKLAAASKRMAAAVRNRRSPAAGKSGEGAESDRAASGSSSANSGRSGASGGGSGSSGGDLGQTIEDLESSLSEWSDALSEAERQIQQNGECDSECQGQCDAGRAASLSSLDNLSRQLRRMAARRRVMDRLAKLCQACSQCQSGLCQSPGASPKTGKGVGASSNVALREERDELTDNGQTTALKGIKGEGPSLVAVETADEGSGTSGRTATAKERSFQRQFESYVSREDVPEEVRLGVKRYFESIHQIEEQP